MTRTPITRSFRLLVCVALAFVLMPGWAVAGTSLVPNADDGGGTSMVAPDDQEAVVARLFDDVLSQRLPDVCPLLMAAGAIAHTPLGEFVGPAGFEEYVAGAWSAFPDATFRIVESALNGDHLTVHWTMSGRHLGDFGSHQATGTIVSLEGIAVVQFQGGMIAESWLQYDRMSLVEQIEASQNAPTTCPPCELP